MNGIVAQFVSMTADRVYPKAYLPNLQSLTTCHVDSSMIKSIVKARRKAGVPLKRVAMSSEDPLYDKDEQWLVTHLEDFEVFVPSDSEDDDEDDQIIDLPTEEENGEGGDDDDEDAWEDEDSTEEDDTDDDDDDAPGGMPLFSPLARHIGRRGRSHIRMTLD